MKYMLLIHSAPEANPEFGTPEFDTMIAGYAQLSEELAQSGVLLAGEGLQDEATATTVRVRAGKTEVMDGPHAITKEHLGGFYLIDVPDLDAAMAIAAKIPSASYGSVEIRPVEMYDL